MTDFLNVMFDLKDTAVFIYKTVIHRRYYMAARRYEIALRARMSEIFFQHEKRNFVSPSGHVMFYLLYKYQ